MNKASLAAALAAALFLTVACGGGGGGGDAAQPQTPPPAASPAEPAPTTSCAGSAVTWTVGPNTCNGVTTAAASGAFLTVRNTTPGLGGTATFACNNAALALAAAPVCKANAAPTAVLQATTTGLLATLSATGSTDRDGTITTYAWNFGEPASGEANTATGPNATHTYSVSGIFTVTLVVTDDAGSTGSASFQVSPAPPLAKATGLLNDTGVTRCFVAGTEDLFACNSANAMALSPAQDGQTGRDTTSSNGADGKLGFSFTKLGSAGQTLPASAPDWSCVRDDVTGMIWEVKSTDNGPRDVDRLYTNYSPRYNPRGEYGKATDAIGFVAAVNAQGLCGARDWRLPTPVELQSLADYEVAFGAPAIDVAWFPRTSTGDYWTSQGFAELITPDIVADLAWTISGQRGLVSFGKRDSTFRVRLVRAEAPAGPRWTASQDGQEVTDNFARLIWRRCSEGSSFNGSACVGAALGLSHEKALMRARDQAAATGKAWRMPNVKELTSLVERGRNNPAMDPDVFPASTVSPHWTSTPWSSAPYVWEVSFDTGSAGGQHRLSQATLLRLVRDAP